MAYGWSAMIWENRQNCEGWDELLFLSLEIGFRCFDPQVHWAYVDLNHTEHHLELADAVFKSNRPEAITDLLCALTMHNHDDPAITSSSICKQYIFDLCNDVAAPFPSKLRQLVMHSITLFGRRGFEELGAEKFVGLLNHLHIGLGETKITGGWISMLLKTATSPEAHQYLTIQSWELLVQHLHSHVRRLADTTHIPLVTSSLLGDQEWDKLECWMGVVWMAWPSETDDMPGYLKHATESLFRQRPGAARKLRKWVGRWREKNGQHVPESFERVWAQAREAAL